MTGVTVCIALTVASKLGSQPSLRRRSSMPLSSRHPRRGPKTASSSLDRLGGPLGFLALALARTQSPLLRAARRSEERDRVGCSTRRSLASTRPASSRTRKAHLSQIRPALRLCRLVRARDLDPLEALSHRGHRPNRSRGSSPNRRRSRASVVLFELRCSAKPREGSLENSFGRTTRPIHSSRSARRTRREGTFTRRARRPLRSCGSRGELASAAPSGRLRFRRRQGGLYPRSSTGETFLRRFYDTQLFH